MLACEFKLNDQYGKTYNIKYPQEKICVLVFADRASVSQVEKWVRALYESYQDKIFIYGVAQLKGVPRWLQSTIRGIFKKFVKFSVMMDWSGEVCRAYGYKGGKAYVVIVNRNGVIQHTFNGRASEDLIQECRRIIDHLKPVLL
ncbi:MAG: hypothetical protein SV375_18910 [Thermodesulfobacteriota bacterium]|nr:hypothetical protein [Thermodesulfobacteriota bacterium]